METLRTTCTDDRIGGCCATDNVLANATSTSRNNETIDMSTHDKPVVSGEVLNTHGFDARTSDKTSLANDNAGKSIVVNGITATDVDDKKTAATEAAAKVFGVAELLQSIIDSLIPRDVSAAKRVSKDWRDAAETIIRVKRIKRAAYGASLVNDPSNVEAARWEKTGDYTMGHWRGAEIAQYLPSWVRQGERYSPAVFFIHPWLGTSVRVAVSRDQAWILERSLQCNYTPPARISNQTRTAMRAAVQQSGYTNCLGIWDDVPLTKPACPDIKFLCKCGYWGYVNNPDGVRIGDLADGFNAHSSACQQADSRHRSGCKEVHPWGGLSWAVNSPVGSFNLYDKTYRSLRTVKAA